MLKKIILSKQFSLFSWALLFFIADTIFLFACGKHIIYLVWGFYSTLLFFPTYYYFLLFLLMILLMVESFIGSWWAFPLLYLLPLTLFSYILRHFMYNSLLLPQIVFVVGILVQILIIEPLFIGISGDWRYTASKIIGNIIIGFFISLFFRNHGKQDNRL